MRDIGKNIKDLRIRKNMTQDELAEKLFVTRQTVSNYETGKSRPDIEMLDRIAGVLGADIHQVLYGTTVNIDQQKKRRLMIGGILTALAGICAVILVPYASFLKSRYWVVGVTFLQYFFVLPLFFLVLGWTLAHVTGMALRKEPLRHQWCRYIIWVLIAFLAVYFFSVLSFLIPELIGEYRFIHATGNRSLSDYTHIPAYADFLFYDVLFPHMFARHTPEICVFTLPFGVLLWIFGFLKSKKV